MNLRRLREITAEMDGEKEIIIVYSAGGPAGELTAVVDCINDPVVLFKAKPSTSQPPLSLPAASRRRHRRLRKPELAKTCAVAEMEYAVEHGCSTPGCTAEHTEIYVIQECHAGEGLSARYEKGSGVLNLTCRVCNKPVINVGVALI